MRPTGPPEGTEDLVRYHLHRALSNEASARYESEWIHASEVTQESPTFCPREWALYDLTGKRKRDTSVTAAAQLTYDVGHMYQSIVTNLLGTLAVGNWTCTGCGAWHEFTRRPECHGDYRYHEVRFTSRACGASCGIDVLVQLPGREKLTVVEVKSEKQDEFKKLVMPRAEHRARTSFYLRIIQESGDTYKKVIDTTEARVLYVSKGGWGEKDTSILKWKIQHDGAWSPFKEYVVKRDDALNQPYWNLAKRLHDFRTDDVMPPGICGTQFTQRAKGCPVVGTCFAGHYPPGEKAR